MICACYRHTNKVAVIHPYQLYGVWLEGFYPWQCMFCIYLCSFVPDGAEKDCIKVHNLLFGDCGHTTVLCLSSAGYRNDLVDFHAIHPSDDTCGAVSYTHLTLPTIA